VKYPDCLHTVSSKPS